MRNCACAIFGPFGICKWDMLNICWTRTCSYSVLYFIHFYSASHSTNLSEALPTTAIDTVSEFTWRSATCNCEQSSCPRSLHGGWSEIRNHDPPIGRHRLYQCATTPQRYCTRVKIFTRILLKSLSIILIVGLVAVLAVAMNIEKTRVIHFSNRKLQTLINGLRFVNPLTQRCLWCLSCTRVAERKWQFRSAICVKLLDVPRCSTILCHKAKCRAYTVGPTWLCACLSVLLAKDLGTA